MHGNDTMMCHGCVAQRGKDARAIAFGKGHEDIVAYLDGVAKRKAELEFSAQDVPQAAPDMLSTASNDELSASTQPRKRTRRRRSRTVN